MKRETRQLVCRGTFAGLMIGIGCTVYLACPNKLVGALLFSSGLFFILSMGGSLFTGLCGLKTPWKTLVAVLGLNALGALIAGLLNWPGYVFQSGEGLLALEALGKTPLAMSAAQVVRGKLGAHPVSWLTNGVFCGILMYLAVMGYKRAKDTPHALASVMYAIPVFIVAGFEHSIADMGYLAIAMPALTFAEIAKMLGVILVVVAGNVIGSKLLRYCLEDWQQ